MLSEQRRQEIVTITERDGRVGTKDLSRRFGVSEVTIRSDLEILHRKDMLTKTHGGAIARSAHATIAAFGSRMQRNMAAKRRIAAAAAGQLQSNQSVILDGGSTLMQLAMRMPDLSDVVVATTAMNIAQHLMHRPGLDVHMIGGRVFPDTVSTLVPDADKALGGLLAHQAFIGAHAIDRTLDLVDVNEDMARTKRNLAGMARRIILLADSSKWDISATSKAFSLSRVDLVITDTGTPKTVRSRLREAGVEVLYA